ncbi:iron ABC transporter substrate-binding protein [Desulfonatronum lacustre]|uniref:iron ABC transporter substrate-binding protein n=1 Tax=Desulfonatronum lacustre TaxID=66849 RepID=UPI0004B35A0D|nr:iron ABC transporter substrate-binding protein [Desulfonatronum lacustre]
MCIQKSRLNFLATLTVLFTIFATPLHAQDTRTIMDMLDREVVVPNQVDRVICSGSGCLRLLVYLQGQDRIVGVDSAEKGGLPFGVDARPYAVANPGFGDFPLFGEFRGHDNPELIAALDPAPQVIIKANAQRDGGAEALQAKTGIPVVGLGYGNLTHGREHLNQTLRIMAQVIGEEERAEAVIAFFDALQADLEQRAARVAADDRPSTFIGGIAMRGGHGFASTEPAYAPFAFLNVRNMAGDLSKGETGGSHATVAKEQLLLWDPEVVFLDISTTRLQGGANGLEQLRSDPTFQALTAVQAGRVYGVFPYNFYTTNYESVFANAYFIGSVLYPDQFADIDPMAKAEEIAAFLNGGPAFERINKDFDNMGFVRITVQ